MEASPRHYDLNAKSHGILYKEMYTPLKLLNVEILYLENKSSKSICFKSTSWKIKFDISTRIILETALKLLFFNVN